MVRLLPPSQDLKDMIKTKKRTQDELLQHLLDYRAVHELPLFQTSNDLIERNNKKTCVL